MTQAYSVVIPAFNAAETIADAIESVLRQTVQPERIVLVDDGSTDKTGEIAQRYGPIVFVIRQANAGGSAATNHGIDAVETPLLACLDADDIWLADKIARQAVHLAEYPDVDGVFSQVRLFRHGQLPDPGAPVRDQWGRTTMLIRTERARAIGPLIDPPNSGGRGDMVDWISRGRDLGFRFVLMPAVLALRRVKPGSMSHGHDQRDIGYLLAVKAALDRRRTPRRD
jgi:glycosyltransferase involved in cell wall biosynthesis